MPAILIGIGAQRRLPHHEGRRHGGRRRDACLLHETPTLHGHPLVPPLGGAHPAKRDHGAIGRKNHAAPEAQGRIRCEGGGADFGWGGAVSQPP